MKSARSMELNRFRQTLVDLRQPLDAFCPPPIGFDERLRGIRQPFTERSELLGDVHLRLMEVPRPSRELLQRLIGVNQWLIGPNERLTEASQRFV